MEEVDVYLSADLYNNNKLKKKTLTKVAIDSNMLSYIRGQSRDSTYTIAKYMIFEQKKDITLSMLNLKILLFLIL